MRPAALLSSAVLAVLPLVSGACMQTNAPVPAADPGLAAFACQVQPVLARSCSAPACHGSSARHFKVVAPARMRLHDQYPIARAGLSQEDVEAGLHPRLTDLELRFNYQQALGFVRLSDPVGSSQLLTRPLAMAAGGMRHAPAADVFDSVSEPGFQAIARWIAGEPGEGCP